MSDPIPGHTYLHADYGMVRFKAWLYGKHGHNPPVCRITIAKGEVKCCPVDELTAANYLPTGPPTPEQVQRGLRTEAAP